MMRSVYLCIKPITMSQTAMTIRMDSDLKMQFDALCDEFGMSTNTAFNIFARAVVRKRQIPFIIEATSNDDVSAKGKAAFDEINEEIRLVREGK